MSERLQAVVFVAILVAAIAALYATAELLQPAAVRSDTVHLVTLEVRGDGWTIHYRPAATANNSVFGILREASTHLGFSLTYVPYEIPQGVYVTSINGSANGDGGRYWQYWVGGTYGTVAADHQGLQDNDLVLWKFSIPMEGA
jgi:hypothetical protein